MRTNRNSHREYDAIALQIVQNYAPLLKLIAEGFYPSRGRGAIVAELSSETEFNYIAWAELMKLPLNSRSKTILLNEVVNYDPDHELVICTILPVENDRFHYLSLRLQFTKPWERSHHDPLTTRIRNNRPNQN